MTEPVWLEGPGDPGGIPGLVAGIAPCCPAGWDWQECRQECQQELLYQQW